MRVRGLSNVFTPIGKMEAIAKNSDVSFVGELAKAFVDKVRSNIDEQTYTYEPLSKEWLARKRKEGHGVDMFWMYMGVLYKSIQRKNIGAGRWWAGVVGSGGEIRTNPKFYGAKNEALRPLFEPTVEDFVKEWNMATKKLVEKIKVV
jgi:hypothetical protein